MSIKITQLGNLTGVYGNTIIPVVANVAGDWTTVKGNLTQFGTYINQAEIPYGNIIPVADAVYSLGTPSYRFKDLYLLGSTIYLGNATISIANAAITASLPITASSVNASNINVTNELNVSNLSVTSITTTDLTTTGTVTASEISATGNITAGTVTTSNISVSGELTASNLAVSGNTINVGSAVLDVSTGALQSSVPIEGNLTSTANLTMQGTRIEFAQGAYIVEEEVYGSPGEFALTLTSAEDGIVGLNAMDANANVVSSVVVSNVAVQLNVANIDPGTGNVNVWYFDSIGGAIFPDNTRQDTAYDPSVDYSNVKVASYLSSQNIASYSNVNVQSLLPSYSGLVGNNMEVGLANSVFVYTQLSIGAISPINYANTVLAGTNEANGYVQLNIQNINTVGNLVSADFIATAPNGSDTTNFIDMGINGNNYSQSFWTISGANDGYVFINGGHLTLGTDTPNKTVSIHTGGILANNIVTTFSSSNVTIKPNLVVTNSYVPSLANSAGVAGQVVWDSGYVYICVATNTWKRANISTW